MTARLRMLSHSTSRPHYFYTVTTSGLIPVITYIPADLQHPTGSMDRSSLAAAGAPTISGPLTAQHRSRHAPPSQQPPPLPDDDDAAPLSAVSNQQQQPSSSPQFPFASSMTIHHCGRPDHPSIYLSYSTVTTAGPSCPADCSSSRTTLRHKGNDCKHTAALYDGHSDVVHRLFIF